MKTLDLCLLRSVSKPSSFNVAHLMRRAFSRRCRPTNSFPVVLLCVAHTSRLDCCMCHTRMHLKSSCRLFVSSLLKKNSGCSFFLSDKRSSSHCFGHYREMHLFYDIQSVHWETELLKICLLFFHTETSKRTNQRCEGIPISCHKVPHFHLAIHSASQFRLSRAQHVLPAA